VLGIPAGWNATTQNRPTSPDGEDDGFDLAVGSYTVAVVLNKKYRDYFKISTKSATVKLNLKVVKYVDDQPQPGPSGSAAPGVDLAGATARIEAAREQSTLADEHSAHIAGQGDDSKQISAYLPGFAPPAKVPLAAKAAPKTGPKPDLRSLPAWGISIEQGTDPKTGKSNKRFYVNFGATVWNAGTSPLLVDGFRRTGTELMDAYQYFFDAKGNQVGSVAAGTMQWDNREGHKHWHFKDFAQYNLLKANKKLATTSGKEAFCLANTDAVDYTVPNAKWRPDNTDLSTACGGNTAVAVREVLDIGNGDTYSQARPGQSFEVTGLPNGTYYIEVKANPANKLSELNTSNNSALRKIVLGGTATKRTLTVPPVNGIKG
jgi:Lysyl oxidase